MHNKVSPERFRHLSRRIQVATKLQDWKALQRYDMELRDLLESHQMFLDDPLLAPEISRTKAVHEAAYRYLASATAELKGELELVGAQQERALAYQLATTMGY
ncbi:LafD [Vibrio olivae]|uniref:LafD n=1 Tax=Vibrio olivae TaxID=1243002 RepID=A0ABV5HL42_9VIBR